MISEEQLVLIKHELQGTCQELSTVLERLEIDEDNLWVVEDRLLDGSDPVERCAGCNWWFESCMLEYTDQGGLCDQCWEFEDNV